MKNYIRLFINLSQIYEIKENYDKTIESLKIAEYFTSNYFKSEQIYTVVCDLLNDKKIKYELYLL